MRTQDGKLAACGVAFVDGAPDFLERARAIFASPQSYIEFHTSDRTVRLVPSFFEVLNRDLSGSGRVADPPATVHCAVTADAWSPDMASARSESRRSSSVSRGLFCSGSRHYPPMLASLPASSSEKSWRYSSARLSAPSANVSFAS